MGADMQEPPFFYTNNIQAWAGAYDFTISFRYRSPTDEGDDATVQCNVAMSLSHAKTMIPMFAKLIAGYEQEFGKVPAPGYEEQARE